MIKIENTVEEEDFMEQHLEQIIDPNENITSYLYFKWTMIVFLYFCFFSEVALMIGLYFIYPELKTHFAIICYSLFIMSLLSTVYGIWALSKNVKRGHFNFLVVITINIICDSVVTIFVYSYCIILLLRLICLIFDIYLVKVYLS